MRSSKTCHDLFLWDKRSSPLTKFLLRGTKVIRELFLHSFITKDAKDGSRFASAKAPCL